MKSLIVLVALAGTACAQPRLRVSTLEYHKAWGVIVGSGTGVVVEGEPQRGSGSIKLVDFTFRGCRPMTPTHPGSDGYMAAWQPTGKLRILERQPGTQNYEHCDLEVSLAHNR